MDTSNLSRYAPKARRDFIAAVTRRAAKFGLTAEGASPVREEGQLVLIEGQPYPRAVAIPRQKLAARIEQQGFQQVMEAAAYTWFNRFAAFRFMELHGYLDHSFRVFSPSPHGGEGRGEGGLPEILDHAQSIDLPGLDRDHVVDLKMDGTRDEELYRELLLAQCRALHQAMPFLFERLGDETELLLPDNLLQTDSLIRELVTAIPEALTLIDPASGSGHILVEAYELFKAIYLERGYRQRDVSRLILETNLFGLDIDERAAQLTGFALMMKGRADDRRLFDRGVKLNVMALVDSTEEVNSGKWQVDSGIVVDEGLADAVDELVSLFEHATTFGSLIQVPEGLAAKLPGRWQSPGWYRRRGR